MVKFIDEIANVFVADTDSSSLNRCIITPNRRASRFIKEAIIKKSPKGCFLPQIFSIDDFIFNHIQLIKIEEVDLHFILFEVMNEYQKGNEILFDDFLNYSATLLRDFNEIDMNMAQGKSIFTYLSEAKAIQQWNLDGSPLSPSQKEYLSFYNHLAIVYEQFRDRLNKEQSCYQGMGYRHFAENADEIIDSLKWDHMIIAGFNALTSSEEIILKGLIKREKVQVLWDVDHYYLNNSMMEAGMYMRRHKKWSPEVNLQATHHFMESDKKFHIIGSPGLLGQARLAAQIIEQYKNDKSKTKENNGIAIIPADENLLLPLLNSLPKKVLEESNITMGFPISHSHAYRLIESFIRLHLHAQKINFSNDHHWRICKSDLIEILNNDLIKNLEKKLQSKPKNIPLHFVGHEMLLSILREEQLEELKECFGNIQGNAEALNHILLNTIDFILTANNKEESTLAAQEKDALLQIKKVLIRLVLLIQEKKEPKSFQSYYTLYRQLIKTLNQSFKSDFNKNIQLMGLLETRLMDFENVILLSTNEDILPAATHAISFIPADIRFEYDLPGIQERTAVFAYHFYRLIQRAKNIHLVYSTTKKKLSGGEKSRFLKQLEFELPTYNKQIQITQQLLNFKDLKISQNQAVSIPKDQEVIRKLHEMARNGLSPTKIISYVKCPLQFYLKNIAKIKEPDEPMEVIDERTIGIVIHHILEDFYRPYVGMVFPYDELKRLLNEVPEILAEYFKKADFKGKLDEGSNYLSYKDTEYYLKQFIKYEIKKAEKEAMPLKVIAVEKQLERAISIKNLDSQVIIRGIADRIDKINGELRILDYKTGTVDANHVRIPKYTNDDHINKIFYKADYDKTLQLFIYDWMFKKESDVVSQSGIISFRKIQSPYLMFDASETNYDQLEEDFTFLIDEIFDPQIDFKQTNEEKTCNYCIYQQFCGKNSE